MDDEDDDDDENEFESKLVSDVKYISHVEVKEEVIVLDDTSSDGESTLSDNEKIPDKKEEDCIICCKYRSMFIILRNHDCSTENDEKCNYCAEITQWSDCFKNHRDSHQIKKEPDPSSDSTASDREENEAKCKICLKYEFMVPLLKSHNCRFNDDQKCPECNEVLDWMSCYKKHTESHDTKDIVTKIKEEKSSDSTNSDNEEIEKLLSPIDKLQWEKCQICLKYQGMFIILEENHMCDVEKPNTNCEKCNEIIEWYKCFDNHKKTHQSAERNSTEDNDVPSSKFGGKFDCGICLKLNSIVTHLVKNHKCADKKLCSVCKEVSYWLSCLKSHKQSETMLEISESEDVEAFKILGQQTDCAVCSKFRATIVNLSDHVCHQRKGNQKCKTCVEFSFWVKNFKDHEKHHTNEVSTLGKYLSCPRCGKRFSGEKMLDVHKSYCKSSSFTCDICDRKFVNMFFLKKHKIFQLCRSSAINMENKCNVCDNSNSSDCKSHEHFHDLKPFKCAKELDDFESEIF